MCDRCISHGKKVDYLFTIADNHPDILNEAQSLSGVRTNDQVEAMSSENTDGLSFVHSVWTTSLPAGFLWWGHARQLIRVERVCVNVKVRTPCRGHRADGSVSGRSLGGGCGDLVLVEGGVF